MTQDLLLPGIEGRNRPFAGSIAAQLEAATALTCSRKEKARRAPAAAYAADHEDAVDKHGLEARAIEGSPFVSDMFTHIYHERMASVFEEQAKKAYLPPLIDAARFTKWTGNWCRKWTCRHSRHSSTNDQLPSVYLLARGTALHQMHHSDRCRHTPLSHLTGTDFASPVGLHAVFGGYFDLNPLPSSYGLGIKALLDRCRIQGLENQGSFKRPGHDGRLPASANIWRKGLVYTRRSPATVELLAGHGHYRVSAAFKCGAGVLSPNTGFRGLYQRVRTIATRAISEKACSNTGQPPSSIVSCHGWRQFGDPAPIFTAFVMLELSCSPLGTGDARGESEPTERDLFLPGGASLEELARLTPHRADELYNEFDFTELSMPESDPITLSYGERVSNSDPDSFEPFVQRAERLTETYYSFLRDLGETRSRSLRIIHREWFLANSDFVTVNVCFDR